MAQPCPVLKIHAGYSEPVHNRCVVRQNKEDHPSAGRPSMKTRIGYLNGIGMALALTSALPAAVSSAQEETATLKEQIVGTWTAISQYVDQDGKKIEPFGSNPKGMVVYDAHGRFVLVLQRATLPKFASNNRMTGTPEENKAIVQGSIAYFGRYSIDEKGRKLILHYEGSTYPNWDGEDQTRLIAISGDDLNLISPASAVGGGTVHLVLRRVK
jgi:Lipocalin-like domain